MHRQRTGRKSIHDFIILYARFAVYQMGEGCRDEIKILAYSKLKALKGQLWTIRSRYSKMYQVRHKRFEFLKRLIDKWGSIAASPVPPWACIILLMSLDGNGEVGADMRTDIRYFRLCNGDMSKLTLQRSVERRFRTWGADPRERHWRIWKVTWQLPAFLGNPRQVRTTINGSDYVL